MSRTWRGVYDASHCCIPFFFVFPLQNGRVIEKGSCKGVVLFCFKGICAKDDGSVVSLFLKWNCRAWIQQGKRFKTSKQGLEQGVISERDTPSDLLQHLAEFQANYMQLSRFESKSVWFLRLHFICQIQVTVPPTSLYTHFQTEGLERCQLLQCFPCPGQWGDLPGCAGQGPVLLFPHFASPKELRFGFCCLNTYMEGSYCEDFWSKTNDDFWETTSLLNRNTVGNTEREVIPVQEIWEFHGSKCFGNTFRWADLGVECEVSQTLRDTVCRLLHISSIAHLIVCVR